MQGHQTREQWGISREALTSPTGIRRNGGHDSGKVVGGGPVRMLQRVIVECNLVYPCGRLVGRLADLATAIKRARTSSSRFIK